MMLARAVSIDPAIEKSFMQTGTVYLPRRRQMNPLPERGMRTKKNRRPRPPKKSS